jgi:hypothetical protein
MIDLPPLYDPPAQRHSATSRAAADEIAAAAHTLRARVFALLKRGALTDEEMQFMLEMNPSTQRPRRIELTQAGLVRDSGTTRPTLSNRDAVVWEIVDLENEDSMNTLDLPPLDTILDLPSLDQPPSGGGVGADESKTPKTNGKTKPKPAAYSEALSENIHVCTPERELEIVRSFASIGLDPCGNATSTVKARVEWWGKQQGDPKSEHYCDGLVASWRLEVDTDEIAFMNCPYGKHIVAWVAKANEEAERGVEIIGLLPGRFDTKWFRSMKPARICWYGRRIPFVDHSKPEQKDTAKFPSVFPYWGNRVERFEEIFGKHGVVTTWK